MRRRAAESRRPVRRRLIFWIWPLLLFLFSIAAFILFAVQHNHRDEDRVEQPVLEITSRTDRPAHNFTEQLRNARSYARQLAEQMALAKSYVVIAKDHNNLHLAWELSSMIRQCQLLLSRAATRAEPISLDEAEPIVETLSSLIFKAQQAHYDIATKLMTMTSHIQALKERASTAAVQAAVFGRLAAESTPKSLECVGIKLTADWVRNESLQILAVERASSPRLVDNNLYHFCIFSDNVVAVSVVINSTAKNAEHPKQLVFHIVTSGVKYGAMQAWFLANNFEGAAIEVRSIEELTWLNSSYSPTVKRLVDSDSRKHQLESSLLNHLRFYVPEIYPHLEKVVFLDDDVVVQRDLTPLFSLDLHGNVNGAVETCLEAFHRYYNYLNFSNPIISARFDPQSCGWAFGVNVFDLIAWKRETVTLRYHRWEEENRDGLIWRLGTVPPGLLAFDGLTEPLDRRWHVLGLGYDMGIDDRLIETAAVVHYNGNVKPWLSGGGGGGRYRQLWEQYLNGGHEYLQDCVTS